MPNYDLFGQLSIMTRRTLEKKLRGLAGYYPTVVVNGPRQSGKSTLCRMTYLDKPYVPLEIESGATTSRAFFKNILRFSDRMKGAGKNHLFEVTSCMAVRTPSSALMPWCSPGAIFKGWRFRKRTGGSVRWISRFDFHAGVLIS